jgi:regulator of nonsense transcripts 2
VVVALHNRFPELFTPPFSSLLLQGLKPGSPSHAADKDIQEKENNARIIKQRTTLRIVGELEAIGIVRKESGGGGKGEKSTAGMTGEITWAALRDLVSLGTSSASFPREADPRKARKQLTSDKEALPLVAPLAIAFAKHLGPLYLPPPPASSSGAATANPESTDEFPALAAAAAGEGGASEESSAVAPLVPREIKDKFRKLLVAYFEALGKREQKLHLVRRFSLSLSLA